MNSCRRLMLDTLLETHCQDLYGNVLDVGGKKKNKRGKFNIHTSHKYDSLKYLNIDSSTEPDYLSSADNIPLPDKCVDFVLLIEVLEHLENPLIVLNEINRILKDNGKLFMSIPFLFPVHADPCDYQRYTEQGLINISNQTGYNIETTIHMGGVLESILDVVQFFLKKTINQSKKVRFISITLKPVLMLTNLLILWRSYFFEYKANSFTTGYFLILSKTI